VARQPSGSGGAYNISEKQRLGILIGGYGQAAQLNSRQLMAHLIQINAGILPHCNKALHTQHD
jgi:polysaccharide deacetylase 2 family uncharacterized protein YibQ